MKVLVIGLDGATFDLIKPFAAQGQLPHLKKLMDAGAWSELSSTIPPVTASAWTSFMTGKNPGAHGLFDFMQRRKGSYDLVPVSSGERDGKTLWEVAGDAGRKVIVMGVPVTYPPTPVNGLLVTGMLTPRGAKNSTIWPAESPCGNSASSWSNSSASRCAIAPSSIRSSGPSFWVHRSDAFEWHRVSVFAQIAYLE